MFLRKIFLVSLILILIFPFSIVNATVNNEVEEKIIENVIENSVENTTENSINENVEVFNEISTEVNNEISNEILNEIIIENENNEIIEHEEKNNIDKIENKENIKIEEKKEEAIVLESGNDFIDEFDNPVESVPYLEYKAHVQNRGWEKNYREDGETSGSTGSGLRLEALEINLKNYKEKYPDADVKFSTYVDTIGWNDISHNNGVNGSIGKGLRLEALKLELTGSIVNDYSIFYRVHVQNYGWLKWTSDGDLTGVVGQGYRMEAIELMLVKRDGGIIPEDGGSIRFTETPVVSYTTHVQNIGWQKYVQNGERAGTRGFGYRLEGIKIKVISAYSGDVEYAVHVQNIGDQAKVKNNEFAGTEGFGYRLERIWINLTGELAEKYDICYRVHSQNYGDLDWAMNGKLSGTEGFGYRLEGIEIKLIPKGTSGPAPNRYPFHKKYKGTLNVESLNNSNNLETVSIPEDGKIIIKGTSDVTDDNQNIVVKINDKKVTSSTLFDGNKFETTIWTGSISRGTYKLTVESYSRYNDLITGQVLSVKFVPKTYVGVLNIVEPFDMEVATIPDLKTNRSILIVKGWAISDDKDAKLNLYIDNNLWIKGLSRTSEYTADIEGFEIAKQNTEFQGFFAGLDIENLSIGTHVIRVEMVSRNNELIDFEETRFQINRRVFEGHVYLDTPVNGYINQLTQSTELEIRGWVLNTDPNYGIQIFYDDVLIADNNNLIWHERDDLTKESTGLSEELLNSIDKPGFKFVLNTAPLVKGRHVITVKTYDRWKNVLKEEKRVIRIEDTVCYGVDLSHHNEVVDWDKLSEKGVSFAIIRVGYWLESEQKFYLDEQFERNYEEAKKRNIKVGSYLFSHAFDGREGRVEAEQALKYLKDKDFELPIFMDVEWGTILKEGVWGVKVTRDTLTDAIVEFCSLIENNGFDAGVYANKIWFENYIDTSRLNEYDIWLANYTWDKKDGTKYEFKDFSEIPTLSTYGSRVDIWQYTSTGKLIDNTGYFDLNVAFKKYL